jgi:hypothetical protein
MLVAQNAHELGRKRLIQNRTHFFGINLELVRHWTAIDMLSRSSPHRRNILYESHSFCSMREKGSPSVLGVPGRRCFETLVRDTLANAGSLIDVCVWDAAARGVTALASPWTVTLLLA